MIHIRLIFLFCFLIHYLHGIICNNDTITDREALLSFKLQLMSDPKNALSGWKAGSNHCTWYGVTCSRVEGRVQNLTLSELGLYGTLPSHLSNLTHLHTLHLSRNSFHGHIPSELGQLQNLQRLDLSVNNLTGKLPLTFGNLLSLHYLALARNNFVGEIPSELGKLSNLSLLQLSENNFTGEFPTSIFNISSLVFLSVTKNNLTGKLPHNLGHTLPNLRNLTLAHNMFEGVIPDSISNATHLEYIDLDNNRFHGPLPLLKNLKNITHLVLGKNYLSSTTSLNSQFFDSLRNSTKLQILMINDNYLAGQLSNSVANMSSSLQQFCCAGNQLTGKIPQGLEKFQNLISLSLENNNFTGEIPTQLGVLQKLQNLMIYKNKLSGEIPDIFGNLTNLYSLGMSYNQFSGRIPTSIGQCKRLNLLYLGINRLGGTIPKEIFEISGLEILYLGGNSLHGSLPSGISNLKQIQTIDVSNNRLSGYIPEEIGGCSSLNSLLMGENNFNGSIPNSLGNLASLQTLNLSSNNLTGTIPENLERLGYMVSLNLSFNHFEGETPTKGVFMNLSRVDLRGNSKLCSLNKEIVHKLGLSLCVTTGKKKRNMKLPIIVGATGAAALLISMLLSLLWMMMRRKKKPKEGKNSLPSASLFKGLPQNISYSDIRHATNNFAAENLIGKGGFGSVYKGVFSLSSTDENTTFAVKVLDLQQRKATQSFNAECEALRNVRHRNLVKVITSCSSLDHKGEEFKALVMQFMPNGNLDRSLHPKDDEESGGYSLTLLQRLNIAIDVASAIDYLHHDCDPPVVHCDLKPANVLLDENMVAHVGDFGLARCLFQNAPQKESSTLGLKGSIGYIAPEYGLGGKASTSGDVYSFGILLLEMFTAKRPTDEMFKEGLSLNTCSSAMDDNQVPKVSDKRFIDNDEYSTVQTSNTEECIAAVIRAGLCCTAQHPKDRLTMREASAKLQGIRHSMLAL